MNNSQLTSPEPLKTRSGGQLLVECLLGLGASKAFGVPGESYLAVLDAFYDTQSRFDLVLCRNEGGAGFMAAAYGKLTGRPGLCFVTRGPGATNASIGVHTAMQDSAPMILFVGQVALPMRGREAFQELDYRAVFGSMAKWVVEIDDADRIPELLMRAWSVAVSGRPGPVVVALPEDMLQKATTAVPLTSGFRLAEPAPSAEAVAETRALLAAAKRPVILVSGCNWTEEGKMALKSFAERSAIPVLTGFRAHDQFDNDSPAYAGSAGVAMPAYLRTLFRDADAILAINVRFGEITTDGYTLLDVPKPVQALIHVSASAREIGKVYAPRLGIQAGPNAFSKALSPVVGDWSAWSRKASADYERSFTCAAQPSPVDMVAVMRHLRERVPPDVILTNGGGNFSVWPNKFFRFGPRARLLAPQSGAMGYGLAAAIAAKVAYPDRMVVCFAGDGDFQMNCQELATARQAGAQPIVLVLNNGIYGTIRAHQERHYPGRVSGTTIENPDFVALARAYGYHAQRVEETAQFPEAFERACASRTGAVLELVISAEAITPWQTLSEIRAMATGIEQ